MKWKYTKINKISHCTKAQKSSRWNNLKIQEFYQVKENAEVIKGTPKKELCVFLYKAYLPPNNNSELLLS